MCTFPPEIIEDVIGFISEPYQPTENHRAKRTLLTCAALCRFCVPAARRNLLRFHFPGGVVKIYPNAQEVHQLADVFGSPLCTLNPRFIKTLHVTGLGQTQSAPPIDPERFFPALFALDAVALPSLRTISLYATDIRVRDGKDVYISDSPVPAILSQILYLKLGPSFLFFNTMIPIIRTFPALRGITALGCYLPVGGAYPSLPPPESLRKLDLDLSTFLEMTDWLMRCMPSYAAITSLCIRQFCWGVKFQCLWDFLHELGPQLEEFELHFDKGYYDFGGWRSERAREMILTTRAPSNRFVTNSSLKRFVLGAPMDILTERLVYFFHQTHFAPQLETLGIVIHCWSEGDTKALARLSDLDRYIRMRHSVTRVIVSREERDLKGCWSDLEGNMRYYMPCCNNRGLMEFR